MEMKLTDVKGHKVIELSGDVDFYCIEELRKFLFNYVKNKTPSIILDLSKIEYMDSSGIGLFVTVHKAMDKYGGQMALLNVKNDIIDLLKLATIESIFKIYNNAEEIEDRRI